MKRILFSIVVEVSDENYPDILVGENLDKGWPPQMKLISASGKDLSEHANRKALNFGNAYGGQVTGNPDWFKKYQKGGKR
jgi:hypothetical protein